MNEVDSSHVSGLLMRRVAAGPDGFRERDPNKGTALEGHTGPRVYSFVGSTDCHLLAALLVLTAPTGG